MKKLLLLIAVLMVIPAAMTAQTAKTRQWKGAPSKLSTTIAMGDVNGDGDVNVTDVTLLVGHILGNDNSNFIIKNADVNGDGDITVTDVTKLVSNILDGNQGNTPTPDNVIDLVVGQQVTDTLNIGSDSYIINNNNSAVATVEIQDCWIIFTGISKGRTTITVTDINNTSQQTFDVRVSQLCPDNHHPHIIDLGLPSGTKWACCNVDTDYPENQSPTDYGGYYAWGETSTKDLYYYELLSYQHSYNDTIRNEFNSWVNDNIISDKTYYYHLKNIGSNICGTQYDVAHVKWGEAWQMPTYDQMVELVDNVIFWETFINGVKGVKLTSRINDTSIFLPYADFYERDYPALLEGTYGYYWTGTLYPRFTDDGIDHGIISAWCLTIYSKVYNSLYHINCDAFLAESGRPYGLSVRPIWTAQ